MKFEQFKLKELLVGSCGAAAAHHLSEVYCEILSVPEILSDDPEELAKFSRLSLGYPGLRGSQPVLAAIADWYPGLGPEHVLPANGSDDSYFALVTALCEPGDRLVVQFPTYPPHIAVPRGMGYRVDLWHSRQENKWAPDFDDLKRLLRPENGGRVKMLLINNPQNPTGYVMSDRELQIVLNLADEHGTLVLCDEIFRGLYFEPEDDSTPLASMADHAISLSSLSKSFGLPGLRVGWIATRHAATMAAVARVHSYMDSFVTVPGEFLAVASLRRREAILGRNRDIATKNLAMLDDFFSRHSSKFAWVRPRGGPVGMVEYRAGSASAFSKELLESAGTVLAPSTLLDFGDRHFRFGFGTRAMPAALASLDRFLVEQQTRQTV